MKGGEKKIKCGHKQKFKKRKTEQARNEDNTVR